MEEIDEQYIIRQPNKDNEYKNDLKFLTMLVVLALVSGVCGMGVEYIWTKWANSVHAQQPVDNKRVYVHDTVCVKDTTQVQYLEGVLQVEQNKVIQLEKELRHCENDKNYSVITVIK